MKVRISPFLWFDSQAFDAARFYCGIFPDSKIVSGNADTIVVEFELSGQRVMALNGGPHYKLSPAFSFFVNCTTQAEVDQLWEALLADGGTESRCGWLEDRFGLSWQIIPEALGRLMGDPDQERAAAVREAMLTMSKINVAELERAYNSVGTPASAG